MLIKTLIYTFLNNKKTYWILQNMDDNTKKYEIKNNVYSKINLIENVVSILYKLYEDKNFQFQKPLELEKIQELESENKNLFYEFMYNSICSTKYFYQDLNAIGINRFFNKFLKVLKIHLLYRVSNRFCMNNKYAEVNELLTDFKKLNTIHNEHKKFDVCHRCDIQMKLDLINDSYECQQCGYYTRVISEHDKVKYFIEANPIVDENNKKAIKYIKNELSIIYGQDKKEIPNILIQVITEKIARDKIQLDKFNIGFKLREIMDSIKDDERIKGKINITEFKKHTSAIYKKLYPNKKIPMLNYKEERYCINFLLEFMKLSSEAEPNVKYNTCYAYMIACFINNMLSNVRRNEEILRFIYIQKEDSLYKKDSKTKKIYKKMGFDFKRTEINYCTRKT